MEEQIMSNMTQKKQHLFSPKVYALFTAIVLFSALLSYCVTAQAESAQNLLDAVLTKSGTTAAAHKLIIVTVLLMAAEFFRQTLTIRYENQVTNTLQSRMMRGILGQDFQGFREHNQDDYLSMFNNELPSIISDYYNTLLDFIFSVLSILFYSLFLIQLQPLIAVIVILSNVFPMLVPNLFTKEMQKRKGIYLNAMQDYNRRLGDGIKGFSLLKFHNRQEIYSTLFQAVGATTNEKNAKSQTIGALCNITIGLFAYASYVCIILSGILLIEKGALTPGGLLAAITVSEALVDPVVNVSYQATTIHAIRDVRQNLFSNYIWNTRKNATGAVLNAPISKIEIRDLSFSYNERQVFDHLNVTFEKNKKYLIRGGNGTGKSTLLKILTKQYDYEGSILVNGLELRDIEPCSYYDKIGYAMQKPYLFNTTLEQNITLFQKNDTQNLEQILIDCQAEHLVRHTGLSTEYHDGRSNISGGEMQKVALARLSYDQKSFQIWDEALSAFDHAGSHALEKATLTNPEITLLHVQHMVKDDLIPLYDEVFVLENGKLVKKE